MGGGIVDITVLTIHRQISERVTLAGQMILQTLKSSRNLEARFADAKLRFNLAETETELCAKPPLDSSRNFLTVGQRVSAEYQHHPKTLQLLSGEPPTQSLARYESLLAGIEFCDGVDIRPEFKQHWNLVLNEATHLKLLAELLALGSVELAREGRFMDAHEKLCQLINLGNSFCEAGLLLFKIVAMATRIYWQLACIHVGFRPECPAQIVAKIRELLASNPLELKMRECMRHEVFYALTLARNEKRSDTFVSDGFPTRLLNRAVISESIEFFSALVALFESASDHVAVADQGQLFVAKQRPSLTRFKFGYNPAITGDFCKLYGDDEVRRMLGLAILDSRLGVCGRRNIDDLAQSLQAEPDPYGRGSVVVRPEGNRLLVYSKGINRLDDVGPHYAGPSHRGSDDVGYILNF